MKKETKEDYIFIDTSVYISNNYFESAAIKQILKWGQQGYIKILLPEITYSEIKKNSKESIEKAIALKSKISILKNIPSIKKDLKLFEKEKLVEEFSQEFDKVLNTAQCIRLPYSNIDIGNVFSQYFKNVPPFHTQDKKNEFPDAFALAQIEDWCEKNDTSCLVFSSDKGMASYKSKRIAQADMHIYSNEKLKKLEERHLSKAQELYSLKEDELIDDIKNWVEMQLEDLDFFSEAANGYEVQYMEVDEIEVGLLGYSFTSVAKPYITFHSNAKITYKVKIEIGDEGDGPNYGDENSIGTIVKTIEEEIIVPVEMRIEIPLAGEEYMDIEVYQINHDRGLPIPK